MLRKSTILQLLIALFIVLIGCGIWPVSGTNFGCAAPPAGLVIWWPGDGNANDIIGSNDGSLSGGAFFAPGFVDQAFSFDGTGHAEFPTLSPIQGKSISEITFETWINSASDTGDIQQIIEGHTLEVDPASLEEFFIEGPVPGLTDFGIYDDSGTGRFATSTTMLALNTWYHIAATYDGFTQKLYINGVLENSLSWAGSFTIMTGAKLGRDFEAAVQFFSGLIDEFSIYDRALTQSEIMSIYDAGTAGKCKS